MEDIKNWPQDVGDGGTGCIGDGGGGCLGDGGSKTCFPIKDD